MLGFNSAQEKDNGRYVPVKVTVKRPGLKVHRARRLRRAVQGQGHSPAGRAPSGCGVGTRQPDSGLAAVALRAVAAPFKGKGKTASIAVALEMDPHGLGLSETPDGGMRGSVEVRMVATDVRAKTPAASPARRRDHHALPERPQRRSSGDLHVLTKTDLQPGRYQLRIAVGTAQRGGSVIYDLEVPDYTKKDLAMSGLVLRGSNEAEGMFLPAGDPLRALSTAAPDDRADVREHRQGLSLSQRSTTTSVVSRTRST